ncbi:endonuclease/exonuclease/phosphatase family protein [Myxococcus stipitatus]|nr:endonuclease/exonuclease/phosphatase family protein [Myxococcus stipitatus]
MTDGGTGTDGGVVTDGGTTTDGGVVTDGGTGTDGGSTTDGGVVTDGGTGSDGGSTTDGGVFTDGGTGTDGGVVTDGGTGTDGGSTTDGGVVTDGGTSTDGGTTDGGSTTDGGTGTDGGTTDGGSTTDGGTSTDGGTTDGGTDAGTDGGTTPGVYTDIRIMAANISSGNGQDYDLGHGIRLMQGVKPDVVLIQEFNYLNNSASDIASMVNQVGQGFYYYREGGAQIPNGIISRWPIIQSGEWKDPEVDNRDFAWARIDIPGPRDLWAVSVHLLTRSASARNAEANAIVNNIRAQIPASDYLVIGGDFNTDNRSESCFGTFQNVVVTAGPYPADKNGNGNTNASRAKPYDHVVVDADLNQYRKPTVIGNSTFPNGLVLDSRVYTPISEIAPAQTNDSGAPSMQHMGVIKDFRVPAF